jgi:hypothetical protein
MVKVSMPTRLADKLSAVREFGEDLSDVILRLAQEARAKADAGPFD